MDSNHDIVPTLRMMGGVMVELAADEIDRLRSQVVRLGRMADTAMIPGSEPTHRCKVCGAYWRKWNVNGLMSWNLNSHGSGKCCDNTLMADQIEELASPAKVGGDERGVVERMARAMNIATDGHDRYWSGYVKSAEAAYRAALSAEGGETLGQKKAAFLKHEGAVETGVMLRAENRIALVTHQGRVEWYDANEFGGIQLSAEGGEDKRDEERYRWLVERFVGYDFDWMPSEPDAADGVSVAVFEIGREFRGSRDITASIDDHRAANQAHKEQK